MIRLLFVGLTLLFAATGAPKPGATAATATKVVGGVQLVATPLRVAQASGILLVLINNSKTDVSIGQRFLVNAPGTPPVYRDVWLDVRDQEGAPVPFRCTVDRIKALRARDFAVLRPGKAIGSLAMLDDCYDVANRNLSVTVHVKHSPEDVEALPKNSFVGELTSDAILIGPDSK
jgi:hypothetical protein